MQEIKFYVSAAGALGVIRDYANAKGVVAPTLVRGCEVMLKMRLFADTESPEAYPIEQLQSVTSWQWIMDKDYDSSSTYLLEADNTNITVQTITEDIDEISRTFTEVAIPLVNMNTEELAQWIGTSTSKTGLNSELIGYDSNGRQIFVLQLENFTLRNRISSLGTPTEIDPEYMTAAQINAIVADLQRQIDNIDGGGTGGGSTDAADIVISAESQYYAGLDVASALQEVGKDIENLNDYTAFEVFAHDYTIPVGNSAELGDYVTVAISPGMTETFMLQMRDGVPQSENNVVIDWGDGATTDIASASVGTNGLMAINDSNYTVSHTYAETGKYIVRIYGTHYNEINHDFNGSNNLMCRVFDYDLPIHPQFVNYTRMCCHAPRLLKVETSSYASITKGVNFYRMFYSDANLRYAYGFSRLGSLTISGGVGAMFMNCSNLINTDMVIPCNSSNWMWIVDVFNGCKNLNTNLDVLLPACIFLSKQIDYTRAFKDCEKLGGTVPAKYFWDNSNLSLVRKDDCFTGCTKLASQVPVSWGGTASDDLITPSVTDQIAEINKQLDDLEAALEVI